jgi:hypothetical protein
VKGTQYLFTFYSYLFFRKDGELSKAGCPERSLLFSIAKKANVYMKKFLISAILVALYLQSSKHLAQQILEELGGEVDLAFVCPVFHPLLDSDEMLVEGKGLTLCQAGSRCCQEWACGVGGVHQPFFVMVFFEIGSC